MIWYLEKSGLSNYTHSRKFSVFPVPVNQRQMRVWYLTLIHGTK